MEEVWREQRATAAEAITNLRQQLKEVKSQDDKSREAEIQRNLDIACNKWKIFDLELEMNDLELKMNLDKTDYQNATTAEDNIRSSDLCKIRGEYLVLLRKSVPLTAVSSSSPGKPQYLSRFTYVNDN